MNPVLERANAMQNPPHLGKLVKECMDDVGWNASQTAKRLGCDRSNLSRLIRGRIRLSTEMALALENIGWGAAEYWLQIQITHDLAQHKGD